MIHALHTLGCAMRRLARRNSAHAKQLAAYQQALSDERRGRLAAEAAVTRARAVAAELRDEEAYGGCYDGYQDAARRIDKALDAELDDEPNAVIVVRGTLSSSPGALREFLREAIRRNPDGRA